MFSDPFFLVPLATLAPVPGVFEPVPAIARGLVKADSPPEACWRALRLVVRFLSLPASLLLALEATGAASGAAASGVGGFGGAGGGGVGSGIFGGFGGEGAHMVNLQIKN